MLKEKEEKEILIAIIKSRRRQEGIDNGER